MKSFSLSLVTVLAMGTFAVAGGDIAPVVEPMVEVVAPVADDSGFYIGGAYSMANAETAWDNYEHDDGQTGWEEIGTAEVDYNAVMLQAGYQFNKYLAVEGRYWHSFGDGEYEYSVDYYLDGEYFDSDSDSGDDGSDEFTAWGIYVKPMYPVTDAFTIYGLLGYGNVTLDSDHEADWLDESGFQWGAGASYAFTNNLSFFVDYVELYNDEREDEWSEEGDPIIYYGERDDTKVYTVNLGLTYKF